MMRRVAIVVLVCAASCMAQTKPATQAKPPAKPAPPPPAVTEKKGQLIYATAENGDRVPDFSTAGYMGGGVDIPNAPVRVVVPRADGDNTAHIQAALDHVASLQPDDKGIRGAVLLQKGRYDVSGQLKITASAGPAETTGAAARAQASRNAGCS